MARLLAPLEQISHQHPEPVIQELASDLRAAIATRGAYQSDSVADAAQCYSQTKNQVTNQNQGNHVKPGGDEELSKYQSTCCSVGVHSTALVPSHSQNTASHGTVSTSAEVRERTQGFLPPDGKSFRPKPAASTNVSASTTPMSEKVFSEWLLEACDPDVPTRAMALRALTQCIKDGTEEALQGRDKLLMVSLCFENTKFLVCMLILRKLGIKGQ